MCPTSVSIPVFVTSSEPAPRVTWVFMNARSIRSPSAESAATCSTCFGTGRLSPVSADSSISSVAAVRSRPSAGTRSPASMLTTSPGTSCSIGNEASDPSRRTLALTTIIFWRAATLADALPSWFRPIAALSRVRPIRTTAVGTWSGMKRLRTPAARRTSCIGSRYWRRNACQRGSLGGSANLFDAVLRAARLRLGRAQARGRINLLGCERVFDRQAVPARVPWDRLGSHPFTSSFPHRWVGFIAARLRADSTSTVSTASSSSTGHTNRSHVP